MIKEIIFFSYGDSRLASTWSNVPYLFTKTLEDRGIIVRRIDISPSGYISKIYNKIIPRILGTLYKNHSYSWIRTSLFEKITNKKIENAIRAYKKADLCIFTNYDFYNKYNSIPTLQLCDWTYEIQVNRKGLKPYVFERRFIRQQEIAVNNAEYVVSLFPVCADSMKMRYPNANINYLNRNVINNLYGKPVNNDLINGKIVEKSIIFIGNKKYIEGAQKTLQAFELVCKTTLNVRLNIIGLNRDDFSNLPENVTCYGYLNKSIDKEREIYYKLLKAASVFVNPTPKWGGYSATVEAMYFYTPVVVAPYEDFIADFGDDINFGYYNNEYSAQGIASSILSVLNNKHYKELCENSHDAVKDYTWENYVNNILNLIR